MGRGRRGYQELREKGLGVKMDSRARMSEEGLSGSEGRSGRE